MPKKDLVDSTWGCVFGLNDGVRVTIRDDTPQKETRVALWRLVASTAKSQFQFLLVQIYDHISCMPPKPGPSKGKSRAQEGPQTQKYKSPTDIQAIVHIQDEAILLQG